MSEDEPRGRPIRRPKPTPVMLLTVGTETSPSSHRLTSGLQSDNREYRFSISGDFEDRVMVAAVNSG